MPVATVTIAGREHRASEVNPVVFGRSDAPGVVGLDPRDMGISGVAGSVEWQGLWLVVNRSRRRLLTIDYGAGRGAERLECGQCHAVSVPVLSIRVTGAILTHSIGLAVPEVDLGRWSAQAQSTGTIFEEIVLTDRDRDVAVALGERYLLLLARTREERFPRTYAEAADRLGGSWTRDRVRKQIERLKLRLSLTGPAFEGPRANYDLIEYLVANRVIGPDDLGRLR